MVHQEVAWAKCREVYFSTDAIISSRMYLVTTVNVKVRNMRTRLVKENEIEVEVVGECGCHSRYQNVRQVNCSGEDERR